LDLVELSAYRVLRKTPCLSITGQTLRLDRSGVMNVSERLMAVALASTLAAKLGRINDLSGSVSIVSNNGDERNAREGSKLRTGDTVETGSEIERLSAARVPGVRQRHGEP
jgi:hypothetical protein